MSFRSILRVGLNRSIGRRGLRWNSNGNVGQGPMHGGGIPQGARKPSRFKARYVLALIAPIAGYYYWSTQIFNGVLEDSNMLVSTDYKEAREVIYRTRVSPEVFHEAMAEARERFPDGLVDPEEFGRFYKEVTQSPFMDFWDLLGPLRNSPIHRGKVELKDCLVAAAMLVMTDDPCERLELAWNAAHEDNSGFLNFDGFAALLGRMERTGHILNRTLLRRTGYNPPEYGILDGAGIAEEFYKYLEIPHSNDISLAQFKETAENKKFMKSIGIWYMQEERLRLERKLREKIDKIHATIPGYIENAPEDESTETNTDSTEASDDSTEASDESTEASDESSETN